MSKLRQHSSIFKEAPIAQKSVVCGISIVYIPTGAQAGYILYNTSVEELFEVKVLNGFKRPNILNVEKGVHAQSITTEEGSFWLTPPQQTTESSTDQN
jgi:hypothetical protein